jgi:hypothetical protein
MAMNRIQFQKGLSLPAFLEQFGTEAQCEVALEKARWPDGFRCPRCGQAPHYLLSVGSLKLINVERVGYKRPSPQALYFRVPNWH